MKRRAVAGVFFTGMVGGLFQLLRSLLTIIGLGVRGAEAVLKKAVLQPLDDKVARLAKRSVTRGSSVDGNAIFLTTTEGEYTCNVRYIADELLRREVPYELIWSLRGAARGPYPPQLTLVDDGSLEYFEAAARSKVLIQNGHALQRNGVVKNAGQCWIQTWHGSLGLKRLEGAGGNSEFYREMRQLESQQTDYLISNSQFEDDVFASTYWPGVPSLRLGHARNDVLIAHTEEVRSDARRKVLRRLNIADSGQKLLLFAPTHDDTSPYQPFGNLDFDAVTSAFSNRFGGDWHVLIRTHNRNKRRAAEWLAGLPRYCHDASVYPDMQELQIVADAGLTDYSSWICDFILTRRPAMLYGPYVREFERRRGFYHSLADMPFLFAESNGDLVDNVLKFDTDVYERRVDEFLDLCECMDDGRAAERAADLIEELMSK